MADLEREAFEAFILSQYQVSALRPRVNNCGIVCPESYAHPKIDFAWQAWQARAQAAAMTDGMALLQAFDNGFEATKTPPSAYLTDEANANMTWVIRRITPPYCDLDGSRQWTGRTAAIAVEKAFTAMGLSFDDQSRAQASAPPVAWQIKGLNGERWEDCAQECYEASAVNGRYLGLPNAKRVEVRELYAAPPVPVPKGWQLVPVEPIPEQIAAAAAAAWPAATASDVALAKVAAKLLLTNTLEAAGAASLDQIAAAIATMFPAYRAMLATAPKPPDHFADTRKMVSNGDRRDAERYRRIIEAGVLCFEGNVYQTAREFGEAIDAAMASEGGK